MSPTINTSVPQCRGLAPESVLSLMLQDAACRKTTGTATLVVTLNQGGVTSTSYGIQDKRG